jgi:hypothetical protein
MRKWSHHHHECGTMWSTVEKHNGHTGHSRGFCHHTGQIVYIYILNNKKSMIQGGKPCSPSALFLGNKILREDEEY